MSKHFGILLTLVSSASHASATADLNWLAGHWCGLNHGVYNEEMWLSPRGGSLIGMHRDLKNERFSGFEYFRIVEDGDTLVYWTQPSGQPATAFRAATIAGNRVDFINPSHDFPKRISYWRVDRDTLRARIDDGSDTGKSVEWTWHDQCAAEPPTK